MKKLKLNNHFQSKLDRLSKKAGKLNFLGQDLASFGTTPIVAIVGTRKPTPYGKTVTAELAEGLARAGVIVVSGNALGVDIIAQKAAVNVGGKVIIVVPSGLDNIYPATNRPVAEKVIANGGTVVSEYEAGHNPMSHEFLERNRIIAALSDLVVIPEAAERSGSLNTAMHAKASGVAIGAVPGQITSPMSAGTNRLLKDGAHVVRDTEDVLELLGIDTSQGQLALSLEGDNQAQSSILKAINDGTVNPAELQNKTELSSVDFNTAITMLEVNGRVASNDLGNFRLT